LLALHLISLRFLSFFLLLSVLFFLSSFFLLQFPDFLPEAAWVRAGNWRGPSTIDIPADLTDRGRRVEITGPWTASSSSTRSTRARRCSWRISKVPNRKHKKKNQRAAGG